jgi:two-component system KDP operon response regulator KdpE
MHNAHDVLVIDEPAVVRLLEPELTARGLQVASAANSAEALGIVEHDAPDLVLADVTPGDDGLAYLRELVSLSRGPVVCLGRLQDTQHRVAALRVGAADYIQKPFNPEEVAARLDAILRRSTTSKPAEGGIVRAGDVEVDLDRRRVTKNGEEVTLTRREWLILQCLATNAGKVILYGDLLGRVWGPEYVSQHQYLRVWMSRLRQKLGDDRHGAPIIQTRARVGFVFSTGTPNTADDPVTAA